MLLEKRHGKNMSRRSRILMDEVLKHIVKFDEYCSSCKYSDCNPGLDDNPCNDCLNEPVNEESRRPVNYISAD